MEEIRSIELILDRTARRVRLVRGWNGFWRGLYWGACIWIATLVVMKLHPMGELLFRWSFLLLGSVPLVLSLKGVIKPVSPDQVAQFIDSQCNTHEKINAAVEALRRPELRSPTVEWTGEWNDLLCAEARNALTTVKIESILPYDFPRSFNKVVIIGVIGILLQWIPSYRTETQKLAALQRASIQESGRHLVEFAKRQLQTTTTQLSSTRATLEEIQKLGEQLEKGRNSREESLRELSAFSERIKRELQDLEQGKSNSGKESTPSISKPKNSLGTVQGKQSSLTALNSKTDISGAQLENLQERLDRLMDQTKVLGELTGTQAEQTRRELSQGFQKLGAQMESKSELARELEDAEKALSESNLQELAQSLEKVAQELQNLKNRELSSKQLQSAIVSIGKTLAEQLQRQQLQLAVTTIRRFADQLTRSELKLEYGVSISKELSDALQPAAPYGHLAKLFSDSIAALGNRELKSASDTLKNAAEFLESLLDPIEDGQTLLASLQALREAQQGIGNSSLWSQALNSAANPENSQEKRKGSGGPGVGSGVGTWADESQSQAKVEMSGVPTDNSGVERPGQEARGVTDRDVTRSSELIPTQVKGTINPGASATSISIKGLGVRGRSAVHFSEAIPSAQSEAQSALSQSQVPRAYRAAVRDYFNDLKEDTQ